MGNNRKISDVLHRDRVPDKSANNNALYVRFHERIEIKKFLARLASDEKQLDLPHHKK